MKKLNSYAERNIATLKRRYMLLLARDNTMFGSDAERAVANAFVDLVEAIAPLVPPQTYGNPWLKLNNLAVELTERIADRIDASDYLSSDELRETLKTPKTVEPIETVETPKKVYSRHPDSFGHDELLKAVGEPLRVWQLPTGEYESKHWTERQGYDELRAAFFHAVEDGKRGEQLQYAALKAELDAEQAEQSPEENSDA